MNSLLLFALFFVTLQMTLTWCKPADPISPNQFFSADKYPSEAIVRLFVYLKRGDIEWNGAQIYRFLGTASMKERVGTVSTNSTTVKEAVQAAAELYLDLDKSERAQMKIEAVFVEPSMTVQVPLSNMGSAYRELFAVLYMQE